MSHLLLAQLVLIIPNDIGPTCVSPTGVFPTNIRAPIFCVLFVKGVHFSSKMHAYLIHCNAAQLFHGQRRRWWEREGVDQEGRVNSWGSAQRPSKKYALFSIEWNYKISLKQGITASCKLICASSQLSSKRTQGLANCQDSKANNMNVGKWLWLSWQSSCFQYQRTAVRLQSSAKFILNICLYTSLISTVLKSRK